MDDHENEITLSIASGGGQLEIKCDIIKMKGTRLHLLFFAENGNIELRLLTQNKILIN